MVVSNYVKNTNKREEEEIMKIEPKQSSVYV